MLSGMSPKAPAASKAEITAFLKGGGSITQVKSRKTKRHSLRSKSQSFWGGRS